MKNITLILAACIMGLLASCTSTKIVSTAEGTTMRSVEVKTKVAASLGEEYGTLKLARVINSELNDTVFLMTFASLQRSNVQPGDSLKFVTDSGAVVQTVCRDLVKGKTVLKSSGFWIAIGPIPIDIPSGRVQLYDWVYPLSKQQLHELMSSPVVKAEFQYEESAMVLYPNKKKDVWGKAFRRCYDKILEADGKTK